MSLKKIFLNGFVDEGESTRNTFLVALEDYVVVFSCGKCVYQTHMIVDIFF